MSQYTEPSRPTGLDDAPDDLRAAGFATSEAGRLLCAGTYVDPVYRDAVLDELYVHEERFPAPSVGFDAAPVLAHALRARRIELGWACGIVALWTVGVVLSGGLALIGLTLSALLALAPVIRGRGQRPSAVRAGLALCVRWWTRYAFALYQVFLLAGPVVFSLRLSAGLALASWPLLVAFLLLPATAVLVALRRNAYPKAVADLLSPERFSPADGDRAEDTEGAPGDGATVKGPQSRGAGGPVEIGRSARARVLCERLRAEQHAPLVMYRAADPFCGFGEPYRTWTLNVELVARGEGGGTPDPLDNKRMLERIRPLVEKLRVPSPHGSPEAAQAVRDRLRALEVDECVFLPAEGLPRRARDRDSLGSFEEHRSAAVEEGGETRRHFLRITIGAWDQEVVVTVFVRVHTQGGMLMLEFAPHVLMPVRADLRDAARAAYGYQNNSPVGRAAWALTRAPAAPALAVWTLGRWVLDGWRRLAGGYAGLPSEGPRVSVRELGAATDASLFQRMDIERYLKSVQDRVADGVSDALHDAGYQTGEFEQKIVNVWSGGVFVESVHSSSMSIGDHNTIDNRNEGTGGS